MDCNHFRKNHLAYLDDTLPGDLMNSAQHHVMVCNGCAAHDTLVRRSLMVVRSMPMLEPSAEFQARLRARLAACRAEPRATAAERSESAAFEFLQSPARSSRTVMALAASAVLGVMAWQALSIPGAPELVMQPVIASRPAPRTPSPVITPAMMQAMSTGNPVWPAAMLIDDAPVSFVNAEYSFAELR